MNGHLSISKVISFIILFIPFVSVTADDEAIEEIVVTASFIDEALSELGTPLHVIDGESVTNGASLSIGATIEDLLGVSSSDFGSAVGQPIIRGMSGSRVKILNNGMVIRDVSGLGVDHINDVDMNQVQQIEIVRALLATLFKWSHRGNRQHRGRHDCSKGLSESKIRVGLEGSQLMMATPMTCLFRTIWEASTSALPSKSLTLATLTFPTAP